MDEVLKLIEEYEKMKIKSCGVKNVKWSSELVTDKISHPNENADDFIEVDGIIHEEKLNVQNVASKSPQNIPTACALTTGDSPGPKGILKRNVPPCCDGFEANGPFIQGHVVQIDPDGFGVSATQTITTPKNNRKEILRQLPNPTFNEDIKDGLVITIPLLPIPRCLGDGDGIFKTTNVSTSERHGQRNDLMITKDYISKHKDPSDVEFEASHGSEERKILALIWRVKDIGNTDHDPNLLLISGLVDELWVVVIQSDRSKIVFGNLGGFSALLEGRLIRERALIPNHVTEPQIHVTTRVLAFVRQACLNIYSNTRIILGMVSFLETVVAYFTSSSDYYVQRAAKDLLSVLSVFQAGQEILSSHFTTDPRVFEAFLRMVHQDRDAKCVEMVRDLSRSTIFLDGCKREYDHVLLPLQMYTLNWANGQEVTVDRMGELVVVYLEFLSNLSVCVQFDTVVVVLLLQLASKTTNSLDGTDGLTVPTKIVQNILSIILGFLGGAKGTVARYPDLCVTVSHTCHRIVTIQGGMYIGSLNEKCFSILTHLVIGTLVDDCYDGKLAQRDTILRQAEQALTHILITPNPNHKSTLPPLPVAALKLCVIYANRSPGFRSKLVELSYFTRIICDSVTLLLGDLDDRTKSGAPDDGDLGGDGFVVMNLIDLLLTGLCNDKGYHDTVVAPMGPQNLYNLSLLLCQFLPRSRIPVDKERAILLLSKLGFIQVHGKV